MRVCGRARARVLLCTRIVQRRWMRRRDGEAAGVSYDDRVARRRGRARERRTDIDTRRDARKKARGGASGGKHETRTCGFFFFFSPVKGMPRGSRALFPWKWNFYIFIYIYIHIMYSTLYVFYPPNNTTTAAAAAATIIYYYVFRRSPRGPAKYPAGPGHCVTRAHRGFPVYRRRAPAYQRTGGGGGRCVVRRAPPVRTEKRKTRNVCGWCASGSPCIIIVHARYAGGRQQRPTSFLFTRFYIFIRTLRATAVESFASPPHPSTTPIDGFFLSFYRLKNVEKSG